ncbi:MAG: hypothetical protein A2Y10_17910 [Planctomycetes bacterium GWF2_41_51]|nr:MAG: hypothetical protein A2Y10_17910 [Planctomycetes bacterium GWF2_41_51]HBG25872.1 hypothetical protein [Phycisphaerales bacterium]
MDEVRQKIEEFQHALESQSPIKELFFRCPAVLPAIGLLCGLAVQYYFDLPFWATLAVLGSLVILNFLFIPIGIITRALQGFLPASLYPRSIARIFLRIRIIRFLDYVPFLRDYARNDIVTLISVFLCFCCLGSIRLINFNHPVGNDIRAVAVNPTFARIKAQIISEPRVFENNDWHFAQFYHGSAYTSFYVKLNSIKTERGWETAKGVIKFYISENTDKLKRGDKFEIFCFLDKFSETDNPGQFDTKTYMSRNGVFLCASVKSVNAVKVIESENTESFFRIKSKLNNYATAWLTEGMEESSQKDLIEAMILGSNTRINRELYNDFIKTGLVHLICLSGLNVGIFAGVAWWISKKAGLLHIGRAIASLTATITFLLVVPPQASTMRAGIMFIIFCLSRLFFKRSFLLNSIAFAAILILLMNPMDFLSPGFQLSFGATIGIVLFYPIFYNYLISFFDDSNKSFFIKLLKSILAVFSTGATAWLFTASITAWHFYQVQLLTAIWTIPAMVPATLIIVLGTFKIILNPFLPTLAMGLGAIINLCASALSYLVSIFAKVPLSYIIIGKPWIVIILVIYISLFMWKFFPFKGYEKRFIYPCIVTFLFVPVIFLNRVERFRNLEFTVLSVGHGQACAMSLPNGKSIIIDVGSMSRSNIGTKIINSFLDFKAIGKIDSVFISHDDIDHFNGLPEISSIDKCRNFYTTPQLIQSDSATARELKKLFNLRTAPEKIEYGNVAIERLWPIDTMIDYSDNESSLVLLLEYADRKILLTSDITADVQKKLMELYSQMDIDVMVTPHHGSARTTNPAFVNYFKPEYLITSCSNVQLERTIPEIRDFKESFFTCEDGAVTIYVSSSGNMKLYGTRKTSLSQLGVSVP